MKQMVIGIWRQVEQWLTEEQCRAIRVIPTNVQGGRVVLVWPYCKDGVYSFKSGYHKLKGEGIALNNKPSSSHMVDKSVWKIIWGLKVPSKIQNFL